MSHLDLSVIVPVYNRADVLRYSLESVRRARGAVRLEVVVVDDGSQPSLDPAVVSALCPEARVVRQSNQGLLFARLRGLEEASGRFVLFLDSDDLVTSDKLAAQVSVLDRASADVSYTDTARTVLAGDYDALTITPDAPLHATADAAEFFLTVQPAPHSPAFRTAYLRARVAAAPFPPSPLYNPVAEIWFYHICAPFPARVVKCAGRALIGQHAGARLTNHWEKLAVASLAVQEAFARTCPATPAARGARAHFAAKAFTAWRRLPRDFSPEFSERLLALFTASPERPPTAALGGPLFRTVARLLGPVTAGRLLRRVQAGPYAGCRTMDDAAFACLLATLPPA